MQNKKAVSLVVLVITIIVMIILAGTIILSINNSGIIEKAQNAVDETNLQEVQTLASLKWAEAFVDGNITQEQLEEEVLKRLNEENLDLTPYEITVTEDGVTVALKGSTKAFWVQEGLTVTNGTNVLTIGDTIAYDETNGGSITGLTDVEWAVLGANDKGELLIMSTSNVVSSYRLGYESTITDSAAQLEENQNDWLTGPQQLDKLCAPYGKGEGATSARSIRVEDINKVTGYDPETAGFGEGELSEYGNEVTYSYNGTTNPAYSGSNGVAGTLTDTHNNFYYYDGEKFVTISDLTTGTSGTTFATLKSISYSYYPTTLTNSSAGELKGIGKDTKAYIMLFRNSENTSNVNYWLASPCVYTAFFNVMFSMRYLYDGHVSGHRLWDSDGYALYDLDSHGVRAVVSLSSDIQLAGASDTGWSF